MALYRGLGAVLLGAAPVSDAADKLTVGPLTNLICAMSCRPLDYTLLVLSLSSAWHHTTPLLCSLQAPLLRYCAV